jgi:TRAP transporter TAXI family solute receptor
MWTAIRAAFKIYGAILLLLLAAGALGWQFIAPAPPTTVTLAAGPEGGAYMAWGEAWARHFARDGFTLRVRATAGSVENLALLTAEPPGAEIAIVQGGVGDPERAPTLRSLGAVGYEAVWVFHRAGIDAAKLGDLERRRLAVGSEGSGTRVLALALLAAAGLDRIETVPLRAAEAAEALRDGAIDALVIVAAAPTETILRLLADPAVRLLDFAPRAEAFLAAFPYLNRVVLAAGTASLRDDLPKEPATLLAAAAEVVVREDIHPQIVLLMMDALAEAGARRQVFAEAGRFPSPGPTVFPLHDDAARYWRHGPGFLKRYLPFWVAVTIERTWVLIIPLLTLLIPLLRFGPPLLRWQMERKVYRWYRDVRAIEAALAGAEEPERAALLARLDRLAARVAETRVPLSYGRMLYDLRQHIAFVRGEAGEPRPAATLSQP